MNFTALIAEDEPLLAANLEAELARVWPELKIVANVLDGKSALQQALVLQADILFLDISMPEMSGIEVATALIEEWPEDGKAMPIIVFVTAYDQYAVQAFSCAAMDYILKPVQTERLMQSCTRLQAQLCSRDPIAPQESGDVVQQMRKLLDMTQGIQGTQLNTVTAPYLRVLQVSVGQLIVMVKVDSILYFEAADKYVRAVTQEKEYLLRTTLKELQTQLDPQRFWKIHRGTLVCNEAIESALRTESGSLVLSLRQHADKLKVSRLYAHLFGGM
ncbi:MAG: LytTR family DNA-binding domain-containing protein [Undibacterium sp.]|nr:LytTR family DNA-binding domain-containing protein [Undibacterium sp.]